jgi:pimeloyl-ACP methyl ester carboxylesterase
MEAKRIISSFSAAPFYPSNSLLLMAYFKFLHFSAIGRQFANTLRTWPAVISWAVHGGPLKPFSVSMKGIFPDMAAAVRKAAYATSLMAVIFISVCGVNTGDCRAATTGIQPRGLSFEYRGISIHYEEQGQGQPLILLHGYGASTYSWRHVLPYFSRSYRVIAIDLKGFGLSDKPTDSDYSVPEQSRMVYEFIRIHRLENVILAGHSLGGAVSLLTCLMQSDQGAHAISKLILIDTASYKQDLPLFISILTVPIINELSLSLTSSNFKSRMILRKAFFDPSKITNEMVTTYGANLSLPGASQALIKTAKQMVPSNLDEISERYKSIDIPVLLIWGEKDEIVPLEVGRKLAGNIRNSRLVVVPNCGHVPQEECPNQAIEAMEKFLSAQTGARK